MLERVGLDVQDVKNSLVVVLVMGLVMALIVAGPILVRAVVGLLLGLAAAVTFLAATAVINTFKPDYW